MSVSSTSAGFNFDGVVSGLKTGDIITKLMQLEQAPVIQLQKQQLKIQTRDKAYRDVASKATSLQSAVSTLLLDALKRIVGSGMGTVLSCIPGRLAFVETEDERFILERHNPLEKREYIRFVIGRKDEESHVEQGIFQAAAQALEWQASRAPTPTN